jgi:hypothetical protein
MVDFFNYLYKIIENKNSFLTKIKFYGSQRFAIRVAANIVLPVYFRMTRNNKNYSISKNELNSGKLIVSLASFPKRINRVWLVIETLLRQTKKPDAIILWLSKDQFPKMENVPKSLLSLRARGLRIELRDNDLRSHKKYYYTLAEFPNNTLITVDDDTFYPTYTIEKLYSTSLKYKNMVCCRNAKRLTFEQSELKSYHFWNAAKRSGVYNDIFFVGVGGTLIPYNAISKNVTNQKDFLSVCPIADDIWLNAMCRLVGDKMALVEDKFVALPVISWRNETLSSVNNGESMNDVQMKQIRRYCNEKFGTDPFRCKSD